jgi:hypothetical protein
MASSREVISQKGLRHELLDLSTSKVFEGVVG